MFFKHQFHGTPHRKTTTTLLLIIALCVCIFVPPSLNAQRATAENIQHHANSKAQPSAITYAYLPADTLFFRAETDSFLPIATLPQSYFVALLEQPSSDYVNVSYLDLTGFVLASAIEVCDYEPVTKYASLTASPYNDTHPVNLRGNPDHTSENILASVPPDAILTLYGDVSGSALIPAAGNLWYFVKYTSQDTSVFGYVYSAHVIAQAPAPNIIEKMPPPSNVGDAVITPAPPKFTKPMQIIFIVALCIPAVAVMLLLFRKKSSPDKTRSANRPS